MVLRSPLLEAMTRAARRAGAALVEDLARVSELTVTEKGTSDFVSSADVRAQALVAEELSRSFPDIALVMEEDQKSHALGAGRAFYVDPLDGTTNFLHGIPHFAVSIALAEGEELVAGVILDPMKSELFACERGQGAWLGERRLQVSRAIELERAVVGTGIPHRGRGDHASYLRVLPLLMDATAGIRRMGSAALDLAYVAAGRFEGFFETGLAPWDVAAGALLVREAGGLVTQTSGEAFSLANGDVLAAPPALHPALLARVLPLGRRS